ncbi:hypothetical protein FS842_005330 [Serendipita sp. 407]|nr:hypothetical protein FS842_005330 [Serendipita sp. 407]
MKFFSFTTTVISAIACYVSGVASRVEGPFALYTKSDDPNWNMRVVNIGARNAYMAAPPDHISSPSQIPAASINFYLNTTSTLTPDAPYGHLVWGAQPPYSALFGRIEILDPTSNLQPFFFDIPYALQGYSTTWNFTANKQLQLSNARGKFYGKLLQTTRYNYDTVHWLFGGSAGAGASKVTIWRYDP